MLRTPPHSPVATATHPGPGVALFDRLPERLVLEGFRRWMAGYATGDLTHWEEAWNLHAAALGSRGARIVVDRLARFTRIVRDFSLCPIACFPGGCRNICRQECFALTIVAASQNKDIESLALAMRYLMDPDGHEAAIVPALDYADAMQEHELRLMPVPSAVVEEIAGRPPHERLH